MDEVSFEQVEQYFPGGFTPRDEANAIIAWAVRNGPIEDLHAAGKITDAEMKQLMISACEKLEGLLRFKSEDPEKYRLSVASYGALYCSRWQR